MKKMKKDKLDVFSYGRGQLESRMLRNIRDDGVDVGTFTELKEMFKEDESPTFAAKLWKACYGSFDGTRWELDMEKEYMQMNGFSYEKKDYMKQVPKGCFARELSRCKCEVLKSINKAAKNARGAQIRIKRKSEEMKEETRNKRRKKGETLCKFYNLVEDEKPVEYYAKLEPGGDGEKVCWGCFRNCDFDSYL